MRIGTNFSFPLNRGLPALIGLGWGGAILGLALGAGLILDGQHLRQENPVLQKKLAELQGEPVTAVPPADLPSEGDFSDLRRRLGELNRLKAGDGLSVAGLLAHLEKMAPPGVRLLNFQDDRDSGGIQLVAEALNLEDLSRFLETLEKSDRFSRVNLAKQTQSQEGSDHGIQFSVDLTETHP
jgi:Tfp pilus assembly protein PilN